MNTDWITCRNCREVDGDIVLCKTHRQDTLLCAVYGCEREAVVEGSSEWGCEPNAGQEPYRFIMICQECCDEYEYMEQELSS